MTGVDATENLGHEGRCAGDSASPPPPCDAGIATQCVSFLLVNNFADIIPRESFTSIARYYDMEQALRSISSSRASRMRTVACDLRSSLRERELGTSSTSPNRPCPIPPWRLNGHREHGCAIERVHIH